MPGIRTRYLDEEDAERLYAEHPHLKASPRDFCPTCDKTGTYHWHGEDHPCDCEMQLQLCKRYFHAGIGDTYQRLDWEDYQGSDRHHLDTVIDYIENPLYIRRGVGLFLSGPKGTGKTMVANLVLKELVKHEYSCYAALFGQAKEMFTAGWYSGEDQAYFARRFLHSDVLLLDDVGREFRTKVSDSVLDNILRQRTQAGRPTIVTSNATEGEFAEGYGAGILSLLREKSKFLYFDGTDYRTAANTILQKEIDNHETRPIF